MEECWQSSAASAAAAAAASEQRAVGSSEVLSGGDWQQLMEYSAVSSSVLSAAPAFATTELSYGSSTLTQSSSDKGALTSTNGWVLPQFPLIDPTYGSSGYFSSKDASSVADEATKTRNAAAVEESLSSVQNSSSSRKRKALDESAGAPEEPKSRRQKTSKTKEDAKAKAESETSGSTSLKSSKEKPPEPPKQDYIHVRARRGQATDSHSLAERVRREKISERMKFLQDLVPGCSKVTGKAVMLDEIINYVQSLQRQVEFLSMKLAAVNPRLDFNLECLLSKEVLLRNSPLSAGAYPFQHQLQQAQQALGAFDGSSAASHQAWDCGELQSVVQMFGNLVSFPSSCELERLDPSLLSKSTIS